MDPKQKKWLGRLANSVLHSALTSLIWRLPRWVQLLLAVAAAGLIYYFGLY